MGTLGALCYSSTYVIPSFHLLFLFHHLQLFFLYSFIIFVLSFSSFQLPTISFGSSIIFLFSSWKSYFLLHATLQNRKERKKREISTPYSKCLKLCASFFDFKIFVNFRLRIVWQTTRGRRDPSFSPFYMGEFVPRYLGEGWEIIPVSLRDKETKTEEINWEITRCWVGILEKKEIIDIRNK